MSSAVSQVTKLEAEVKKLDDKLGQVDNLQRSKTQLIELGRTYMRQKAAVANLSSAIERSQKPNAAMLLALKNEEAALAKTTVKFSQQKA